MKVVVFTGSPKGDKSVTKHYLLYARKKLPGHEFIFHDVASKIKQLEKQKKALDSVLEDVKDADLIVWAFPLYVMCVPSQLKRFIELIYENDYKDMFRGKYTISISTSVHFYDHIPHLYLKEVCKDLGANYLGFYSADTWDLLSRKKRADFIGFLNYILGLCSIDSPSHRSLHGAARSDTGQSLTGGRSESSAEGLGGPDEDGSIKMWNGIVDKLDGVKDLYEKSGFFKIDLKEGGSGVDRRIDAVIVVDGYDSGKVLGKMIESVKKASEYAADLTGFNIEFKIVDFVNDYKILGPCMGCMKCSYDNRCVYDGKDDFKMVWGKIMRNCDILIWAGAIKDHYLSSEWKMMLDRSYVFNHTPILTHKQFGYIISGPLSENPHLAEVLQAYAEFQESNFAGILNDRRLLEGVDMDNGESAKIMADMVFQYCLKMIYLHAHSLRLPPTYLKIGGLKVLRDEVYGRLRFVCQADHRNFKKNGFYDTFPQKDKRSKKMNRKMMLLTKIPAIRKKVFDMLEDGLLRPFKKLVEDPTR